MTDIEKLATGIMGWERKPDGYYGSTISIMPRLEKWKNNNTTDWNEPIWNPYTNWNDCMQIVEKLEEKSQAIMFTFNQGEWSVQFYIDHRPTITKHKDLKEAICTAALLVE